MLKRQTDRPIHFTDQRRGAKITDNSVVFNVLIRHLPGLLYGPAPGRRSRFTNVQLAMRDCCAVRWKLDIAATPINPTVPRTKKVNRAQQVRHLHEG